MTNAIASPFAEPVEQDAPDLQDLDDLIKQALIAKEAAASQKATYDSLRDQICAIVRDLGVEDKIETATGRVKLKETRSGWTFSAETEALSIQLKAQQQIEKKNGTAQPGSITLSADVFPL